MARSPDRPGKQYPLKRRTRQHVIADLSRVHTELIFVESGLTVAQITPDYSDDLIVRYYDENGLIEPWISMIQLKASERISGDATFIFLDLDARDVRHWLQTSWPVYIVIFEAESKTLFHAYVQEYFSSVGIISFPRGRRTIRIHLAKNRLVNEGFARYTAVEAERCSRQRHGRIDYGHANE